ncbi:MAG: acyl--CoA ligase [Deltaproteobacteria bacterium]|nr:acyl--CoA ligase [Deltaproteobacteria bacterium]
MEALVGVGMLDGNDLWDLVERRASCTPAALLATDEHGATLSFGELRDRSLALARVLWERKIQAETRVAWLMPTRIDALVLTAALSRLGAVQVPLLPTVGARELTFAVRESKSDVLIVSPTTRQSDPRAFAASALGDIQPQPKVLVLEALLGGGSAAALPPAAPPSVRPEDAPWRWVFYTSGTTTDPKGAKHSDATLAASARGIGPPHRFSPDDRVSLVFPYPHIGGPSLLFSALMVGYALILTETFDAEVVIKALHANGVTLAGPGPAFWQAFIAAQRQEPDRVLFPKLRALIGGGAAKPANLQREAREVLGVDIVSGYGLTECPALAYNHLGDPDDVLATDGRAVLGVEMKTVRPDGRSAPVGVEGEICVKGPMQFLGYLDSRLDAEAIDEEGFVRTGDLGVLDAAGQLRVTGRRKDVIIRKGENISAKEVEDLLVEHPKVREVAVIGLPDPERGERCCAVVVLVDPSDPLTLGDVGRHCLSAGLMKIKIPEQVECVAALPHNSTGKVQKALLRAEFGQKAG